MPLYRKETWGGKKAPVGCLNSDGPAQPIPVLVKNESGRLPGEGNKLAGGGGAAKIRGRLGGLRAGTGFGVLQ